MIINNFKLNLEKMSFEDIIFILNKLEQKDFNDFVENGKYYMEPQKFIQFIEFLFNKKEIKLIEKIKNNNKMNFILNLL